MITILNQCLNMMKVPKYLTVEKIMFQKRETKKEFLLILISQMLLECWLFSSCCGYSKHMKNRDCTNKYFHCY